MSRWHLRVGGPPTRDYGPAPAALPPRRPRTPSLRAPIRRRSWSACPRRDAGRSRDRETAIPVAVRIALEGGDRVEVLHRDGRWQLPLERERPPGIPFRADASEEHRIDEVVEEDEHRQSEHERGRRCPVVQP